MGTGYTQADLDKLRDAMLRGTKEISVGGRRKVFHSLKEMRDLYDAIAAELAASRSSRGSQRRRSVMVVDL
tara:strand:- start:116 stop:328 length:213 start_codon:yes stop_codon:yes gene_type:complete